MTEYGWPPRMLMRVACAYTGRSRWSLARAVRDGTLHTAGKNGRSPVFERAELDRWMVGSTPVAPEPAPRAQPRTPSVSSSAGALARLRALTAVGGSR